MSTVERLGPLPEHWEVQPLKRLAKVDLSNVDKLTVEGEQLVRLCNYVDVYKNERIVGTLPFMFASASPEQIRRLRLKHGDVIITKDSETPDDIGVPALVADDMEDVVCGYHLALLRPKGGKAIGAYLQRALQSPYVRAEFCCSAVGMTRYGLGKYDIENVLLPCPPPVEQHAIASFLDRETAKLDTLIDKQERLIELLQEKRQAVISHAVTKGLDPKAPMKGSGVEWLGEVPAHWQVTPMRAIANVVRGASPRPAGDPQYFGGDAIPWITVAEITKDDKMYLSETSECLTAAGRQQSREFPAGTLLFSNSGATLGVPKICAVAGCANDGVVGFLSLQPRADIRFLYYFLLSTTSKLRDEIKQGAGQPNLNTSIVKSIKAALPPISEQNEIVAYTEEVLRQLDVMASKARACIELMREHRSALISAAATGRIDVRGDTGETPSKLPEAA